MKVTNMVNAAGNWKQRVKKFGDWGVSIGINLKRKEIDLYALDGIKIELETEKRDTIFGIQLSRFPIQPR